MHRGALASQARAPVPRDESTIKDSTLPAGEPCYSDTGHQHPCDSNLHIRPHARTSGRGALLAQVAKGQLEERWLPYAVPLHSLAESSAQTASRDTGDRKRLRRQGLGTDVRAAAWVSLSLQPFTAD